MIYMFGCILFDLFYYGANSCGVIINNQKVHPYFIGLFADFNGNRVRKSL